MLNIKYEQSELLSKLKEQKSNQDSFLLGTNFNFFKTNYTFPNDSLLSWAEHILNDQIVFPKMKNRSGHLDENKSTYLFHTII